MQQHPSILSVALIYELLQSCSHPVWGNIQLQGSVVHLGTFGGFKTYVRSLAWGACDPRALWAVLSPRAQGPPELGCGTSISTCLACAEERLGRAQEAGYTQHLIPVLTSRVTCGDTFSMSLLCLHRWMSQQTSRWGASARAQQGEEEKGRRRVFLQALPRAPWKKMWLMHVISSGISPLEKLGTGGSCWSVVGHCGFGNLEQDSLGTSLMSVGHFA